MWKCYLQFWEATTDNLINVWRVSEVAQQTTSNLIRRLLQGQYDLFSQLIQAIVLRSIYQEVNITERN